VWSAWVAGAALAALVACASAPPPPAARATEEHDEHDERDADAEEPSPAPATTALDAPERARPPSTATYEEALSKPETLDVHDERVHLTDAQLTGPMRGVLDGCRVPPNARVTIKTAVQNGRAIGVTVHVRFEPPKPPKSGKKAQKKVRSKTALEAEAKRAAKIAACADRAVRAIVWPPSRRRDSFTTEL